MALSKKKSLPLGLEQSPFSMETKLVVPPYALENGGDKPVKVVGTGSNPNVTTTTDPYYVEGIKPKKHVDSEWAKFVSSIPAVPPTQSVAAKDYTIVFDDMHLGNTKDYIIMDSIPQPTEVKNPCGEIPLDQKEAQAKAKMNETFEKLKEALKPKETPKPVKTVCQDCKHTYWLMPDQKKCTVCTLLANTSADDPTATLKKNYAKVCNDCGKEFFSLGAKVCPVCMSNYQTCSHCGNKHKPEELDAKQHCKGCAPYFVPKYCEECGDVLGAFHLGKICNKCKKKAQAKTVAEQVAEQLKNESANYASDGAFLGYNGKKKKKPTNCIHCCSDYYVNDEGYCSQCWESPKVIKFKACSVCNFHYSSKYMHNGVCPNCVSAANVQDPTDPKPLKKKVSSKKKPVKIPFMFKTGMEFHVVLDGKAALCGTASNKETALSQKDVLTVKEAMAEFVCTKCNHGLAVL